MALLGNIISDIRNNLNIEPKGFFIPETKIDYIQFPKKDEKVVCQPKVLYVGIKPANFDACPGSCVICYSKAFPSPENVLFLPESTDSISIYRSIEPELLRDIAIDKKKNELLAALKGNAGLQEIINIAVSYLNNPVVIIDTSLSILCCSNNHSNAFDFVLQNKRLYMKPESVKSMHNEKLMERIENSAKPFIFYREYLNTQMMYYRIRIQKSMVGYLCVLAQERSFTEYDFEFMTFLSDIISVEMQKSKFFSENRDAKYEFFLTDLIEGNFKSSEFIHERLTQFGFPEGNYYRILNAKFKNKSHAHLNQKYLIDQLITILPNTIAFFYHNSLVLLKSFKNYVDFDEGIRLKLSDFLNFNQMNLAVSYQFDNILDTPHYYLQTVETLKIVSNTEFGKILKFEDFCLQTLIAGKYSAFEIESFVHPDIKFLINYDRKKGSEYYETLCAYLNEKRSATRAAEKLHIHKTTFFYRFQKIQGLLNKDINDANLLFDYELSIRLQNMADHHAEYFA